MRPAIALGVDRSHVFLKGVSLPIDAKFPSRTGKRPPIELPEDTLPPLLKQFVQEASRAFPRKSSAVEAIGELLKNRRQLAAGAFGTVYLVETQDKRYIVKLTNDKNIETRLVRSRIAEETPQELDLLISWMNTAHAHGLAPQIYLPYFKRPLGKHTATRQEQYQYVIFMEYVEGQTIYDKIMSSREGGNTKEIRTAFSRIIASLSELHGLGINHGDANPSNVFVTPDDRIIFIDFRFMGPVVGNPHFDYGILFSYILGSYEKWPNLGCLFDPYLDMLREVFAMPLQVISVEYNEFKRKADIQIKELHDMLALWTKRFSRWPNHSNPREKEQIVDQVGQTTFYVIRKGQIEDERSRVHTDATDVISVPSRDNLGLVYPLDSEKREWDWNTSFLAYLRSKLFTLMKLDRTLKAFEYAIPYDQSVLALNVAWEILNTYRTIQWIDQGVPMKSELPGSSVPQDFGHIKMINEKFDQFVQLVLDADQM